MLSEGPHVVARDRSQRLGLHRPLGLRIHAPLLVVGVRLAARGARPLAALEGAPLAEGLVLDALHDLDGGRAAEGSEFSLSTRGAGGGHGVTYEA